MPCLALQFAAPRSSPRWAPPGTIPPRWPPCSTPASTSSGSTRRTAPPRFARAGSSGSARSRAADGDPVAVLLDLQGPRIRVGTLVAPLRLVAGQTVIFAPEDEAAAGEIPTTYDALAADVRLGARILLDDGLLSLEVTGITGRPGGRGGALRRRAQVAQGDESPRHRGERAGAHREGPRGRGAGRRPSAWTTSRSRSCAGRRTSSSSARWCRARPSSSPRSRRTRRSGISAASSTPPTPSWSPAAISASSCRSRKCR